MLTYLDTERLRWDCLVYDVYGELVSCGQPKEASLDEVVYRLPPKRPPLLLPPPPPPSAVQRLRRSLLSWVGRRRPEGEARPFAHEEEEEEEEEVFSHHPLRPADTYQPGRGAVLALPPCACGTQTFLKADYSLRELRHCVVPVLDERTDEVWAYVLRPIHARNLRAQWLLYERGQARHAPVLPLPPPAWLEHPELAEADLDTRYALWFGFAAARENAALGIPSGLPPLSPRGAGLLAAAQDAQAPLAVGRALVVVGTPSPQPEESLRLAPPPVVPAPSSTDEQQAS